MGSLRGHVCETLRDLRGVFCSQSARTPQVTDGQSTTARVENSSDCEVCLCNAQGDVMAARVVRDPAGGSKSLPDGAVHEGTRYTAAA